MKIKWLFSKKGLEVFIAFALILSETFFLHFDAEKFYFSYLIGPPGLKGQKGIMGRYGKMGPPGLKGGVG